MIRRLDLTRRETAEEIWALQHRAYRLEAKTIGVSGLPPLHDTVASLQRCAERFYGEFDADDLLAGAISYLEERDGKDGPICVICRLMVDPERLRQGIGSRLVEYVLNDRPHGTVWRVTAESRNAPAIALYENKGFVGQAACQPVSGISMIRFERAPDQT